MKKKATTKKRVLMYCLLVDTKTNAAGIATALNRAYYSIKGHLYIWDYVER